MHDHSRLPRYFIYYITTLLFFAVGAITTLGLPWYDTLLLPKWTPSDEVVALLWCVLFVCTAVSLVNFWERAMRRGWSASERRTVYLYAGNALLILLWNYAFFGLHLLGFSLLTATLVGVSAAALMARTWRNSQTASLLLLPYMLWMIFAVYFNYVVGLLN